LNINKIGAAVAGAVGIFVGLLAGYVQHWFSKLKFIFFW
jgi:ABC-type dipeptide/oligopeptide/nickel transport system permease subunit